MLKNIIVVLIVSYVIWEILEHIVFPLFWLIRNRKKNLLCGEPGMIGLKVVVKKWNESEGRVLAHGELWKAVSDETFSAGDTAIVQSIEGLTLTIAREQAQQPDAQDLLPRNTRNTRKFFLWLVSFVYFVVKISSANAPRAF